MFSAFVTSPPSRAASTCSATITPARSCASSVDAARCGVTTTLSSSSSGPEYGSAEKTSIAAPATVPERSASTSASSVDEPDAVPHRGEGGGIDPAPGLRCQRLVERDEVGRGVHVFDGWDLFDAQLAEALGGDERVVGDHAHRQPDRSARHLLADPAETEHAQRFVCELEPAVGRAIPAPLLERGMCLRDVAREGEQQPDRVLGRGDDRRLGCVRHDDPAPSGRVDVDVVHPHPGPADHAQPLGALDQVGCELRLGADDDALVVADPLGEVAVVVDVDVDALLQERHAGLGDRLPNEDLHTLVRS